MIGAHKMRPLLIASVLILGTAASAHADLVTRTFTITATGFVTYLPAGPYNPPPPYDTVTGTFTATYDQTGNTFLQPGSGSRPSSWWKFGWG